MTSIYGHKWTSQYGDSDADNTWALGLSGVTAQQFAAGLQHCIAISADRVRTGDEDWPPTLGEFRAYCTKPPYPYHNNVPALPRSTLSREEQLRRIEECKRALGTDFPWTYPIAKEREPGEDG